MFELIHTSPINQKKETYFQSLNMEEKKKIYSWLLMSNLYKLLYGVSIGTTPKISLVYYNINNNTFTKLSPRNLWKLNYTVRSIVLFVLVRDKFDIERNSRPKVFDKCMGRFRCFLCKTSELVAKVYV